MPMQEITYPSTEREKMIDVSSKVKYNGSNRPYLKDSDGTVVSLNIPKTSAYVHFTAKDGRTYAEWVGLAALDEIPVDAIGVAKQTLKDKLKDLREKRNELQNEVDELEDQIISIQEAVTALENL